MIQKIPILLGILFLLTAVFAAVPAAAEDNSTDGQILGAVPTGIDEGAHTLVFVSSEQITLIVS